VVLRALSRVRGPFTAALVLGAGFFVILCLYPGAPITVFFFMHPLATLESAHDGKLHAMIWVQLVLTLVALIIAIWWATSRGSGRLAVRAIGGIVIAICVGSLPTGSMFWLSADFRPLLFLGIAQVIILVSIVWSCRSLQHLIFESLNKRQLAWKGIASGAAGSVIAATIALSLAAARGLDLTRLDEVHRFYITAVPAMAGFGWTAPWPLRGSSTIAAISAIATLLIAFYCLPMPFVEREWIRCDYSYERARHSAFGFELEPWHWEQPYDPISWILAPGAMAELTVRYITQPLVGITCPAA
jgi:hypothetical protein